MQRAVGGEMTATIPDRIPSESRALNTLCNLILTEDLQGVGATGPPVTAERTWPCPTRLFPVGEEVKKGGTAKYVSPFADAYL